MQWHDRFCEIFLPCTFFDVFGGIRNLQVSDKGNAVIAMIVIELYQFIIPDLLSSIASYTYIHVQWWIQGGFFGFVRTP